jgi:hypothetical protein
MNTHIHTDHAIIGNYLFSTISKFSFRTCITFVIWKTKVLIITNSKGNNNYAYWMSGTAQSNICTFNSHNNPKSISICQMSKMKIRKVERQVTQSVHTTARIQTLRHTVLSEKWAKTVLLYQPFYRKSKFSTYTQKTEHKDKWLCNYQTIRFPFMNLKIQVIQRTWREVFYVLYVFIFNTFSKGKCSNFG